MFTIIIEDRNGDIVDEIKFDQGLFQIGRIEGNDIILKANSVSRKHAKLFVEQNKCYIEDLGSANGVLVEGKRIVSRTALRSGDRIQIGEFTLYFEVKGKMASKSPAPTHIVSADDTAFKLVRVGDLFSGEEFRLTEEKNTIGRTDENFILLSDPSVSRKHAVITRKGRDLYEVEDLGSSNGTKLNGKVIHVPKILSNGDEIQFGNVRFIFVPGFKQINVQDYAKPRGSHSVTMIIMIVSILLLGVAIALSIYFFVFSDDGEERSEQAPAAAEKTEKPKSSEDDEKELKARLFEVSKLLENEEPKKALKILNPLRQKFPSHPDVKTYYQKALKMKRDQDLLEDANRFVESKKYSAARRSLKKIKKSSIYYEKAQSKLTEIQEIQANEALENAKSTCEKKINQSCVDALCRVLDIYDKHKDTRAYLDALKITPEIKRNRKLRDSIESCLKK